MKKRDKDGEVRPSLDEVREYSSFDDLAVGLADGTLTRGRALKYVGAVVLGGLGAMAGISAFADDADAKRRRRKKKRHGAGAGRGRSANTCPPGRTACRVGGRLAGCCPPGTVCCPSTATGPVCCAGLNVCLGDISACIRL